MKLSIATLTLVALMTQAIAQEQTQEQLKIKAMIQEIKLAGEGERYQKMNAFKEQLRTMNAATRQDAIANLQETLATVEPLQTQTRTQTRTNEGTGEGEQVHTRTQTRTQSQTELMQMQQTQQQIQTQTQMQSQKQMKTMNGTLKPQQAPFNF